MKLLHHAKNGTYRLLMRREQVHNIVCNSPLMPEIQFTKHDSSEFAWTWASLNFVDSENPVVEKLTVKFKNAEISQEFKRKLDAAQKMLATKQTQGR
jgi:E3 SUMO-protein ligase RanBP2